MKRAYSLFGGAAAGAVNGLFGGGGGMIAVPLLKAAGRSTQSAHANALAVVLPSSLVSAAVYLTAGCVPFSAALPVALGTAFGGFLGARLLKKAPSALLTLLFGGLMLAAGLRMLF